MGREWLFFILFGVIVQLEERVPCKDDVAGSTPANSNLISVVKRKPFNSMAEIILIFSSKWQGKQSLTL